MSDTCEPAFIPCEIKQLPDSELLAAADEAVRINPANMPTELALNMTSIALTIGDDSLIKQRLAVLVSKYWGTSGVSLTVQFLDGGSASLRSKILAYANKWSKRGNIKFVETSGEGQVRILRGSGGYWSYLGTDLLRIPRNQQTMNLEGFTESTKDSEFDRVVTHEFGHSLGFPHEHLRRELVNRLDPARTIAYFRRMGWDEATTRSNVLTALEDRLINATPNADQTSIMAYQLPGEITRDGQPITGGSTINDLDHEFVSKLYPRNDPPPPPPPAGHKIYIEITGTITGAKQVASPDAIAKPHVIVSTANDPGAVNVTTTIPSTPPTNGGGTGMFGKILEFIKKLGGTGDLLGLLKIVIDLFEAKQAGQISDAEFQECEAALQQAQAQFGQPKAAKK